jgi:hypothetical protein
MPAHDPPIDAVVVAVHIVGGVDAEHCEVVRELDYHDGVARLGQRPEQPRVRARVDLRPGIEHQTGALRIRRGEADRRHRIVDLHTVVRGHRIHGDAVGHQRPQVQHAQHREEGAEHECGAREPEPERTEPAGRRRAARPPDHRAGDAGDQQERAPVRRV